MKAYGYSSADSSPILFEADMPQPGAKDLLVEIEAIAINPVDIKVKSAIKTALQTPKIVGWDACARVIATGSECNLFKIGDRVFYAGDIRRPGCYATHQLVDERIAGFAPQTLSAVQSAAMPLTGITAWEALFSRMRINPKLDKSKTILIIGAGGGVGSIAIQLAKQVARLNVIATASQSRSMLWCKQMGADCVINHHQLVEQYKAQDITPPDYILCLHDTDSYYEQVCELIAPQGLICFVVSSQLAHDIDCLKNKSAGIVWEFMFTRPMYDTADLSSQHQLLNRIAEMLDQNLLQCTLQQTPGCLTANTIQHAHKELLSGHCTGKIGLTAMASST